MAIATLCVGDRESADMRQGVLYSDTLQHRGEKGRVAIGEVYLPSQLERTPQLCS